MSHGRPERRPYSNRRAAPVIASGAASHDQRVAAGGGAGSTPGAAGVRCTRRGKFKRTGCRPRGMASWNVHLDTWAIMEVLVEGEYAKLVAEILRLGGQHPYSLVVSQVALGEAAAVILRGGSDSGRMLLGMLRLLADSRIDPGRCMPPLSPRVLETTRELAAGAP